MRLLDLFSGIGGFSLGLERAGFETVAFCEVSPKCRHLLAHHWPQVPCYDDIRTLTADRLAADGIGPIDTICGGFPCQDISSSGKRAGLEGARSGLWSEYRRLICELRPEVVFVENVPDLLARGMGTVLGDLAASGYDAEWHSVPASFVGLPQARERIWIVAYPHGGRLSSSAQRNRSGSVVELRSDDDRLALAQRRAGDARSWVRRANDGPPGWVHRLHGLGNAVVPQIPEILGRAVLAAMAGEEPRAARQNNTEAA